MCVQRRMKTGGEKGQTEIKLVRKNTAAVLIASGRRAETKQTNLGGNPKQPATFVLHLCTVFVAEQPGLQ